MHLRARALRNGRARHVAAAVTPAAMRVMAHPWPAIAVNSAGVALLIPFSFQDLIELDMFLYAAALILEFAALVWLRIRQPDLARPFRVPFGLAGVIALSLPPVVLVSSASRLSNQATRYVGLIGLAIGLLVYRWQVKIGPAVNVEAAPTGLAAAPGDLA